jgi:hypothetical protein
MHTSQELRPWQILAMLLTVKASIMVVRTFAHSTSRTIYGKMECTVLKNCQQIFTSIVNHTE